MSSKTKCKHCGAKLVFGPRSFFKKFCSHACRSKYHDAHRTRKPSGKTYGDRILARYGSFVKVNLSPVHAAWLAGFWDGEGSLSITKTTRNGLSYHASAKVGNTNQVLMAEVAKLIGEDLVWCSKPMKLRSPKHKPLYRADVRIRALRSFVEQIQPYLVGKKRQAELLLKFLDAQQSAPITDPNFEAYEHLFKECAMLNRRGVICAP